MKFKRLTVILMASMLVISLSACNKKDDSANNAEAIESTEETKDPFAIGDGDGIAVETKARETQAETRNPEETKVVEVVETQANGLSSGALANGGGLFVKLLI